MKTLTELANDVGCSKGRNGYCIFYEPYFFHLRERANVRILELGLAAGGPEVNGEINRVVERSPSIDLWLEYFPKAELVGFDISDFSFVSHPRFTFVRGDSGKVEDIRKVLVEGGEFDVIIDDASHASYHQQLMLSYLFPHLKPGGIYIIEDLNWVPERYERELPPVDKTRNVLSNFLKNGDFKPSSAISRESADQLQQEIASVLLFDQGYMNALKKNFVKRFKLDAKPLGRGSRWRGKSGLRRSLDPYFWRYLTRMVSSLARGEEYVDRDYIQLAILHRKV